VPALRFAGQPFAASSPAELDLVHHDPGRAHSRHPGRIGSAPPAGEPAWPGEPLTQSEARVLRYLPSHMSAPEIAAELYLPANTVKTHLRHLYRKLGAHSRHEAVKRARAIGLLAVSSSRP
jgi:ATP/maltotriose-dependent transcriptional regulator MalT